MNGRRRDAFDDPGDFVDQLQRDWEGDDFALIEQVTLEHGELRVDGATFWTIEQTSGENAEPTKNMNVAVKSEDDRTREQRAAKVEQLAAFYEDHTDGEGWVE